MATDTGLTSARIKEDLHRSSDRCSEAQIALTDGYLRYLNHSASTLLGIDVSDIGTRAFDQIVIAADRTALMARIEQILAADSEPAQATVEFRILTASGEELWVESPLTVLQPEDASPWVLLSLRDIHQRRSADAALRASERMLRQVTEASADHLTLLDLNLRVMFTNRGLNGRSARQLLGRPITEFMPQHVHPIAIACIRRVLETRASDRYEGEIVAASGEPRHFEFRVSPLIEHDEVIGLTLNGSDITERLHAQQAIATQAKMIESMLEGVAVLTDRGAIEMTNPAFDRLFGQARGILIGQRIDSLADDADGSVVSDLQDLRGMLGKRQAVPFEFEARRSNDHPLSVAGVLSRFKVGGRERYLAVVQDVSERKALERAILEASNREQYRIGNDLHDGLGQELTGIALMLKGVAARMAKEHPAVLPDIDSIARLVSNAVESTRALARGLSPVNLERGGLIDALEGLAMHARDLYSTKVTFAHQVRSNVQIPAELGNHFYRMAQEAVTNAVRHGQAREINIALSTTRGKVRMSITDDGCGIPPDAVNNTGMGLKIMQHRAQITGGTVRFESQSRGTRVVCESPIERRRSRARPRKRVISA